MKKANLSSLIRVAAFLLVLALLLSGLSWLYRPRDNTKEGGMDYIMAHGYLGQSADGIDAFFVGSSEFYSGISPMLIWEESGITSYDYAIGAQRAYSADAMVEKLLRTHHPRLVVLDGYVALKRGDPDEAVFSMASRLFSILENHENWKRFDWEMLAAPVEYTHREINRGFRPDNRNTSITYAGFMREDDSRARFPLMNRLYLEHIRAVCQREDIPLLFIALPSPENWDYAHHNALQDYADKAGIELLDLNLMVDELDIDPETDFRDEGDHLNSDGAEKVSHYLAHYLAQQYGLQDHRGDPAYDDWAEDWAQYPE